MPVPEADVDQINREIEAEEAAEAARIEEAVKAAAEAAKAEADTAEAEKATDETDTPATDDAAATDTTTTDTPTEETTDDNATTDAEPAATADDAEKPAETTTEAETETETDADTSATATTDENADDTAEETAPVAKARVRSGSVEAFFKKVGETLDETFQALSKHNFNALANLNVPKTPDDEFVVGVVFIHLLLANVRRLLLLLFLAVLSLLVPERRQVLLVA